MKGGPPRGLGGGPPAEGPGAAPAAAVGPGGEGGREGKPRQTIQSPNRLYKATTDYTKPPKDYRNLQNIRQKLKILNKYPTYLTRVATNINQAYNIKYPILETQYINKKYYY